MPQKHRTHSARAYTPKGHGIGHGLANMRLPRHSAFYIALAVGIVTVLVGLVFWPVYAIIIGAIATFAVYLGLIALILPVLTATFLRSRADEADTPIAFIIMTVIAIVGVCCASLFMALNGDGQPSPIEVLLSVVSVLLGWFTVHTMAALHYAYEFYESAPGQPEDGTERTHSRGLDFPEGDEPDGASFLYFSYVLGVAFAVSDIRVTSNRMRRLVLMHSTFSFFFNTLIVAGTVNVVIAMGGL